MLFSSWANASTASRSRRSRRRNQLERLETRCVLAAPVGIADEFTISNGQADAALDVLVNDTDADGDPLSIVALTTPALGTLVNEGDSLTYVPPRDWTGTVDFAYTLSDGSDSSTASVTLSITDNLVPTANDDLAAIPVGALALSLELLANDTDPEGAPVSVISLGSPQEGVAEILGDEILYLPNDGFVGSDQFSYTISDGYGGTAEGQVTVAIVVLGCDVGCQGVPPTAEDDFANTHAGQEVSIRVLDNDTDQDGDPIFLSDMTQPQNGQAIGSGGVIQYLPNSGFVGTDEFQYTVFDMEGHTSQATVSVEVGPTQVQLLVNSGLVDPPDLADGPQPTSWETQRSDIRRLSLDFGEVILPVSSSDILLKNLGTSPAQGTETTVALDDPFAVTIEVVGSVLQIELPPYYLEDGVYQISGAVYSDETLAMLPFEVTGNSDNRFFKLAGEWNGDGGVSVFDFSTFSYWFSQTVAVAPSYLDLNGDGGISVFDFANFADNFGIGIVYPGASVVARQATGTSTSADEQSESELLMNGQVQRELFSELEDWTPSRREIHLTQNELPEHRHSTESLDDVLHAMD